MFSSQEPFYSWIDRGVCDKTAFCPRIPYITGDRTRSAALEVQVPTLDHLAMAQSVPLLIILGRYFTIEVYKRQTLIKIKLKGRLYAFYLTLPFYFI